MSGQPGDLDLARLLDVATFAARAGGNVISRAYDAPPEARQKGPGDWVSDIDDASERVVHEILSAAAPEIDFFGEESGGTRGSVGWLVDPLDGTTNFLRRLPVVGVSVALVADGRPMVGVVHAPMLAETYAAVRGGGAYRDGVRLRVSDRPSGAAICATGFPFRAKRERLDEYLPVFGRALWEFEDLRRAGAASLDLAWTAAGACDGYFEQALGPWDVAAGALLVEEAGGRVSDWSGDPAAWLDSGDIVVGSPAVHARILELIAAS